MKPASIRNPARRSFASISTYFRPTEVDLRVGDASKSREKLGWKPKTSFAQLVREMVAGDLASDSPAGGCQWQGPRLKLKGKSVFVAGHRGMVGGALVRRLAQKNVELLTVTRGEVDLRDQAAVIKWFAAKRPQVVFLAAAKVGGMVANNTLRAEFLYDNLVIAANVIHSAHVNNTEKLMFLGSSCWRRSRCARISS